MKADTKQMDELDRILVVGTSANARKCHVWNHAQAHLFIPEASVHGFV